MGNVPLCFISVAKIKEIDVSFLSSSMWTIESSYLLYRYSLRDIDIHLFRMGVGIQDWD